MGSPKLETNKSFKLQHASPDSAKTPEGAPLCGGKSRFLTGRDRMEGAKAKKKAWKILHGLCRGRLPTHSALLYSTLFYSTLCTL